MGSTVFDNEGEALCLFGNVPIRVVKRAFFKDKLGTVKQMMKLVYNSVTYDFTETAKSGAVIFGSGYTSWMFFAPDDRLDFEGYASMTIGQALSSMEATLTENPIPSWDRFAEWLDETGLKSMLGTVYYAQLLDRNGNYVATVNDLTIPKINNFIDVLHMLQSWLSAAANQPMSKFNTEQAGFRCGLAIGSQIEMYFTFRE